MQQKSLIPVWKWLVAVAAYALAVPIANAQDVPSRFERPDLWTTVQDTIHFYMGDVDFPHDMQTGVYKFQMPYDSICTVEYLFTEAWLNGRKLNLRNWIWRRSVNVDEDMLSFNSGTKNFKVKTGDIVSFYRKVDWKDPIRGMKDTVNFFSRDTLAFAVELVNPVDMRRVALIDSICIMAQVPPGKPRIYGHLPAMAVASYKIPARLDGDSVFMRIRVYARGLGEYNFTRTDMTMGGFSKFLEHPVFISDLQILRNCCWIQIPLPPVESASETSIMSVRQAEPGLRSVSIELAPVAFQEVSVVIHDAYGNHIATPFTGPALEARIIPYHFAERGVYIITLLHGGNVLETTKIIVTN